ARVGRMPLVYLAPQPLHVDFDQIGERIEILLPDVFGDLGAADYLAGAPRQIFQERVFLRGQLDLTGAAPDPARPHIDAEIGDFYGLRTQPRAPCQSRPQT